MPTTRAPKDPADSWGELRVKGRLGSGPGHSRIGLEVALAPVAVDELGAHRVAERRVDHRIGVDLERVEVDIGERVEREVIARVVLIVGDAAVKQRLVGGLDALGARETGRPLERRPR
jgi:hypothetical protein